METAINPFYLTQIFPVCTGFLILMSFTTMRKTLLFFNFSSLNELKIALQEVSEERASRKS